MNNDHTIKVCTLTRTPFLYILIYYIIQEMLGVLLVCSPGVLLTLYGNKFEREPVVGPLKLYFFLKLIFIKD